MSRAWCGSCRRYDEEHHRTSTQKALVMSMPHRTERDTLTQLINCSLAALNSPWIPTDSPPLHAHECVGESVLRAPCIGNSSSLYDSHIFSLMIFRGLLRPVKSSNWANACSGKISRPSIKIQPLRLSLCICRTSGVTMGMYASYKGDQLPRQLWSARLHSPLRQPRQSDYPASLWEAQSSSVHHPSSV